MANQNSINKKNLRRRNRSKKTSRLNPNRLRMVIYRSLKHFEVQLVDDFKGLTIVSASSKEKNLKSAISKSVNKTDISRIVGELHKSQRSHQASVRWCPVGGHKICIQDC